LSHLPAPFLDGAAQVSFRTDVEYYPILLEVVEFSEARFSQNLSVVLPRPLDEVHHEGNFSARTKLALHIIGF